MEIGNINAKSIIDNASTSSSKVSDSQFEEKLRAAAAKGDDKELREVCNEFESIFISMMYKQMKATVPKSDFLNSDSATEMFESMLDDELCISASQRGIGIGDVMYKQLSKQYTVTQTKGDTAGGVIDEKK